MPSFIAHTWTAGEVVTAANVNIYLRDNTAYLLNRPGTRIIRNNTASYTTTSSTFVNIDATNLTITLTMSGSAVLVNFSAAVVSAVAPGVCLDFTIDGVRYASAHTQGIFAGGSGSNPAFASYSELVPGLSAAAHVFLPQYLNGGGGTSTIYSAAATSPVCFAVQEVA